MLILKYLVDVAHVLPELKLNLVEKNRYQVIANFEILSNYLVSVLEQNELKEKVVGFCADNCNTNFGGVKRKGKNNVFFKVIEKIERDLTGIGCAAHIVHNCLQHAVDTLPVCVDSLVVKIYKYFHIYTVRVTELKIFAIL